MFLIGTVMKNFISCKMENHQTLHFLFLRGLPVSFVVVGLGVKDDQNDVHGISFSKLSTLEMEPQFRDTVVLMF